ncbi:hypothetical protein CL653_03785 [bacterium]|nr:hypothetical protein [bacterium]|tara:strand:- start:1943 stop:2311 length:369 start_codon:yes stop_codon:yes gene_type:complete
MDAKYDRKVKVTLPKAPWEEEPEKVEELPEEKKFLSKQEKLLFLGALEWFHRSIEGLTMDSLERASGRQLLLNALRQHPDKDISDEVVDKVAEYLGIGRADVMHWQEGGRRLLGRVRRHLKL